MTSPIYAAYVKRGEKYKFLELIIPHILLDLIQ